MDDWKKKKMAVYIRRSEGEAGGVKEQLERILPVIADLEKKGKIAKVNRGILGRDIQGVRRFNINEDFKGKGDVYNEGNRRSAFGSPETRPVLMELLQRVRDGQYDGILFESMDRFSRDPLEIMGVALDLWRVDDKYFASLSEPSMGYYPKDNIREAMTTAVLMFGGIGKKGEIQKAEKQRLGTAADKGWFKGGPPQWAGSKERYKGANYRALWERALAQGENANGRINNAASIDRDFKESKNWANRWYAKMKGWNELGVLDKWLENYEAVNQFILNQGPRPMRNIKKDPVVNLLRTTAGYFSYPAGVNPAKDTSVFLKFPAPLDIGIELLAVDENPDKFDPREIPNFKVERLDSEGMIFDFVQTQPRSGK